MGRDDGANHHWRLIQKKMYALAKIGGASEI